jgi:hypothetical protein
LLEKYSIPWSSYNGLLTKVGVTTPFSPFIPRMTELANKAPAARRARSGPSVRFVVVVGIVKGMRGEDIEGGLKRSASSEFSYVLRIVS